MKRTIRNRRTERRAIRQAQRAMIGWAQGHEVRPVVGPKFWHGVINALLIMAGFVAFGGAVFFFLGGTIR